MAETCGYRETIVENAVSSSPTEQSEISNRKSQISSHTSAINQISTAKHDDVNNSTSQLTKHDSEVKNSSEFASLTNEAAKLSKNVSELLISKALQASINSQNESPHNNFHQLSSQYFGLSSSPASFQLLMDKVLHGLKFKSCLCYLDDVLICSETFKQHITDLREVLHRFRSAGLKLGPKKCSFAQSSCIFLCHSIPKKRVSPPPDRVQANQEYPPSKNVKELRRLIGMLNWFPVIFSMNSCTNAATQYSPFEVVYGNRHQFPLSTPPDVDLRDIQKDIYVYLKQMQQKLNTIRKEVQINVEQANGKMVERVYKTTSPLKLSVGDYVYLHDEPTGQGRKLQAKYTGPFIVDNIPSPHLIKIIDPENKRRLRMPVHINRFKMAYIRAPQPQPYLQHFVIFWIVIVRQSTRNKKPPTKFNDFANLDSELGTESISSDENGYHKIKHVLARKIDHNQLKYLVQIVGEQAQHSIWVEESSLSPKAKNVVQNRPPRMIISSKSQVKGGILKNSRKSQEGENAAQVPVLSHKHCELCEGDSYERKCIECNQFICTKFKRIHKRQNATRKHKVVEITHIGSGPAAKSTCDTHTSEYTLYCKDCTVLVCNRCVTTTHKLHRFCDIKTVAGKTKKQLEEYVESLRESLRKSNEVVNKFHREKKKALTSYDSVIKSVNENIKKIIEDLEKGREGLTKIIENAKNEASEEVKLCETKHQDRKNRICRLINESELSDDTIRIVQHQASVDDLIDVLPPEVEDIEINVPKFIPVKNTYRCKQRHPPLRKKDSILSRISVDTDVGLITTTSIRHSFRIATLSDRSVGCIAVRSDSEAWVACPYDQNVCLVRRNGSLTKEVPTDFNISDISITKSGDLLLSSAESRSFKLLCKDEIGFRDLMDTFPSEPHGVSVAGSGEILVCLTDGDFGHVTRLSETGKIKKEYDTYVVKDQCYLLRKPVRCVETLNGDIWILDEAAKKIVVLNSEGNFRFLWDGPNTENGKIRIEPSGLDCDNSGNILVTDYDNDKIYLISADTTQTETLQIEEKKEPLRDPYGIAIHADKFVWVGCDDGVFHVMRYQRET
ncbi:unnamed protein product [Mytilus coruscus]|uniref:B box-type domain-containing protein n=1 Tax=Mytilus coruscus TaxID=42192 RepID=A0A6J8AHU0_MYTCO|nr:unnamed protein product [Mytilus coruscus]